MILDNTPFPNGMGSSGKNLFFNLGYGISLEPDKTYETWTKILLIIFFVLLVILMGIMSIFVYKLKKLKN